MRAHVCVYVCMYVGMYVCMYSRVILFCSRVLVQCARGCLDCTVAPFPAPVVAASVSLLGALPFMSTIMRSTLFTLPALQDILASSSRLLSPLSLEHQSSLIATLLTLCFSPTATSASHAVGDAAMSITGEMSTADKSEWAIRCMTPYVRTIVDPASAVSVLQHVRVCETL